MVKNFEDWVNEGLWSKGIQRSKSGVLRKEDEAFFKQDDIVQIVEPFSSYYILDDMDENATYIYKYPNTKWLAKFFDIVIRDNKIEYDSIDFVSNLDMDERKRILSHEFRDAIFDTYNK